MGWTDRLLRRLVPSEDWPALSREMDELHRRRVRRLGRRAAERRLSRERLLAVWHFSLRRVSLLMRALRRRAGGSGGDPGASTGPPSPHVPDGGVWRDLLPDVRRAVRMLRRQPAFVVLAALTLGVGIGSVVAVFSLADQVLLQPPPGVVDADGAAYLEFSTPERRMPGLSGPDVEAIRREATLFEGIATTDDLTLRVSAPGSRPADVAAKTVYGDYFEVLGVRPAAGRLLRADETGPDADPSVAVISEALRDRVFGPTADVVGREFRANGHTLTVLGVAGGGFAGAERTGVDVWVPRSAFVPLARFPRERLWSRESTLNQWFVARPRPGVGLDAAEAQLNRILSGLAESDPERGRYLGEMRATLHSSLLHPWMRESLESTLRVLAGAAGLLLLLTCANLANLLLVRGVRRRQDVAVLRALGASRSRVARQLLVETLLLTGMGALVGLAVAWLVAGTLRGAAPPGGVEFEGFGVDPRVMAFAAAVATTTALLSGVLPAVLSGRFDLAGALRESDTPATGRYGPVRHGLASLQIALSLTLLVGGVLLVRTVRNLHAVDPGLDLDGVQAMTLRFEPGDQQPEAVELDALHREVLRAVDEVPGVQAAALNSSYGPYELVLPGRIAPPGAPDAEATTVRMMWVTPEWFEVFGVDAVRGRTFRRADWTRAPPVPVVVTAPLAARLFGGPDAAGRSVRVGTRDMEEADIVGVVGDLRLLDLQSPPTEAVFVPYPVQFLTNPFTVVFRTAGSDPGAAEAVRRAVEGVLPGFAVPAPTPLTDRIDRRLRERRLFARLLGLFSALAVVLAAVGLYGVVAFVVAGRRRELGIRVALGAGRSRIAALVLRSAAGLVVFGTTIGLAGAYALSRVLESRLFGVGAVDVTSYLAAAAFLGAVAALACVVPARDALAADPVATLREE